MTASKEYVIMVAQGAGVGIVNSNKRVRLEPIAPGMFDPTTLLVQADSYEISPAGALTMLANRITVIALAPGTWTSVQPATMERAS
jgi:hypothetical protein